MSNQKTPLSLKVRIIHRYLGYFLAGIMAMYAISGSLMVFRKTNFLKKEVIEQQQLGTKLSIGELSSSLKIGVKVEKEKVQSSISRKEIMMKNPVLLRLKK